MIVGNAIVLSGGGSASVIEPITVTENGTYFPPSGVDGYAPIVVGVTVRSPRCDQTVTFDWATEQTYMAWQDGTPVPRPVPPTPVPLPGPSVSFTSGSDADVAAAIDAAQAGTIDLQNGEHAWHVGDERTIHLDAWTGGHGISISNSTVTHPEVSHPAEDVRIVISSFDEYMGCGNVLQFDFIECVTGRVIMNDTNTSSGGYGTTTICTEAMPALADALPSWLRTRLRTFSVRATAGRGSTVLVTVPGNKLALRSETEIFGAVTYAKAAEGSLIPYYATAANRIKTKAGTEEAAKWWERSPGPAYEGPNDTFCMVLANGNPLGYTAASDVSLAPFGCL